MCGPASTRGLAQSNPVARNGIMTNPKLGDTLNLLIKGDPDRGTVAAAEVGLALAIILRMYRNRATVNVDEIDLMKW